MSRIREREVSTRLIRPTLNEIQLTEVLDMTYNFDPCWEIDGKITVHAVYLHYIYSECRFLTKESLNTH
jgi:hypothetical protein